jgi:hypothetical protein
MPEFILDYGTPDAARVFAALDQFTQGYIEAMYWTSASTPDDGDLDGATFAELAPEALKDAIEDCTGFIKATGADLDEACDNGRINGYDMHRAGVDFWLTRNGHGAGFWDRGLGAVGDRLSEIARVYGTRDLYRGDDGRVYAS